MNDNTKTLLKNLEGGILESSKTIQESNRAIYESIKIMCSDPTTRNQAIIALQKADSVRIKTERIRMFFSNCKNKINSSGIDISDGALGARLFDQIRIHKNELLSIDKRFSAISGKQQLKLHRFEAGGVSLFKKNLVGVDELYKGIFMDKLNSDAVIDENILLNYLHSNIRVTRHCNTNSPILSINSSVISEGEPIEFTAGIGYFDFVEKSKLIVDGTSVYPSDNGLFQYKYYSKGGKGKKTIPVQISYTDMDGIDLVKETVITVTIK